MTYHVLYRHFDADGNLLYVGITNNPFVRLKDHKRTSIWYGKIRTMTFEYFESREELLAKEKEAIDNEKPSYNKPRYKAPPSEPGPDIRGVRTFLDWLQWKREMREAAEWHAARGECCIVPWPDI